MSEEGTALRCEELTRQLENMGFDSGEVRLTVGDPNVTTLTSAIDLILKRQAIQQQSNLNQHQNTSQEQCSPVLRLRPDALQPQKSPATATTVAAAPVIHSRYDSSWKKSIQRQEEERLKQEMSRRKKDREEARQRALQEFQADRKRVRLLHGDTGTSNTSSNLPSTTIPSTTSGLRLRILNAANRQVVVQRNVNAEETLADILQSVGQSVDDICLRMPPAMKFEGEELRKPIGDVLLNTKSAQLLLAPRVRASSPPRPDPPPPVPQFPTDPEMDDAQLQVEAPSDRFPGVGRMLETGENVQPEEQAANVQEVQNEEGIDAGAPGNNNLLQEMELEAEGLPEVNFPGRGHVLGNENEVIMEENNEMEVEQQPEEVPDLAHPELGYGVRLIPMDPGALPVRREPAAVAAARAANHRPGHIAPPAQRIAQPPSTTPKVLDVKTLYDACRRSATGWIARTDCPIYIMRQLRSLPNEQAMEIINDLIKDGRFSPRIIPYLPTWLTQLDLSRYPLITNKLLQQVCHRLSVLTHLNLDASQPMMNVEGLRFVADLCHLQSLSLCGQNRLDPIGLTYLITGCTSLCHLIMRHCSLGSDAAFLHLIRHYFANPTVPDSSDSKNQLVSLDVSGCDKLTTEGLIGLRCFPNLVFLRMVSCQKLETIKAGDIPPLENLSVVELPCGDRITGEAVEKLMWTE